MANAKSPSKGKKTSQNANIQKVKPVPTPVPENVDGAEVVAEGEVVETPVEEVKQPTVEERHETLNTIMVMSYVDFISGLFNDNKEVILRAYIQSLPEDKQELYANNVLLNAAIHVTTYEAVERSLEGETGTNLAANDAFTYATMSAIKEACKGFTDTEINTEIVPLLNYGGQVYILFRESILMQISASKKLLAALSPNAVAAICMNLVRFKSIIIDLFMMHIAAAFPEYLKEEPEKISEFREAFLQANGGIIIQLSLNALTMLYSHFTLDPQQMFASIVGQDNVRKYARTCRIDTTSEKAVSSVCIEYVEEKGSDVFEAMDE